MGLVIEETGGGFKNKILEYVFNRLPIAAIKDSMTGLPMVPGLDYLSFESMRQLAHGVAAVIDDIERLNSMQRAAYEKCDSGFDWSDRGRTSQHRPSARRGAEMCYSLKEIGTRARRMLSRPGWGCHHARRQAERSRVALTSLRIGVRLQ